MPSLFASLRWLTFCLLLPTMAFGATGAETGPVKTPHVEAEIISKYLAFKPGQDVELALRLKIKEHWHTYWRNPGDSGLPTKLAWTLPEGFVAGDIEWPFPKKLPLGPLMNFGYDGEVLHLVRLRTPPNAAKSGSVILRAKADWLVCSDVCIPESAELALTLPMTSAAPEIDPRWEPAFSRAAQAVPKTVALAGAQATMAGDKIVINLPAKSVSGALGEVEFFPYADDLIANAGKQLLNSNSGSGLITLSVPLAEPRGKNPDLLKGILVASNNWGEMHGGRAVEISIPVSVAPAKTLSTVPAATVPGSSADIGLMVALAFAFAGGIFLNIMPCVFPVLGIKVMGFAQAAQNSPRALRIQGLAFLAGVVISFWLLAGILISLRAAGEAIGWGFQLQSPFFVTALAVLFLLLGLNLFGVFEFGTGLQSAAGSAASRSAKDGRLDAFLSGVLATAVATPCTAPLMGAALGFTLSQPPLVSILVFTAIAAGMALPVVALSFFPSWLRMLPKPGAWMETFKQVLAFPLFATVVWLVWVIGSQLGNDAVARLLFGLVLVGVAAWAYGRMQVARPVRAALVALIFGLAGTALAWPVGAGSTAAATAGDADWQPFSREKIAELRASKRPVFVDFTASWCITCQVNKRVALNSDQVKQRFIERGITRMKADWTRQDPVITAALAEFGRNAVPLYIYYPEQGEPVILPEVLTTDVVLNAIGKAPSGLAAAR
jgi:thiol:disulfide interchange protein DsbD